MPRYLVERTFPDGLGITPDDDGARACLSVVQNNADAGVTWLQSYVTEDRRKTFCIYDEPRRGDQAERGPQRPAGDSIVPVRVLDPYFHYAGHEGGER